jgi:lysophospholipase
MKSILLILLLLPFNTFAISEETFESIWKKDVLPFYKSLRHQFFQNRQGLRLHFVSYQKVDAQKTIVILPGQSEPAMKYAELLYDLRETNADIFIFDHQGQGESQRLLKDTQKGHVINFNDYVNDLNQYMDEMVIPARKGPIFLIAHSMGGAVASLYMDRNPGIIEKAVLVAPMLEINTSPYPSKIAYLYSKFLNSIGKGEEYAPGRGPYDFNSRFETNLLTNSQVRFDAGRYLFSTWPELTIGGPTVRWVYSSLRATKKSDQLNVSTPVLMLQAGEDKIVKPGRQNKFCAKNSCSKILFPTAKHEILMERDRIRNEALRQIRLFLDL